MQKLNKDNNKQNKIMKVELQCGDIITTPDGYKAVVKGGDMTIDKLPEFKDGDILHSIKEDTMVIYKKYNYNGLFYAYYNSAGYERNDDWLCECFRYATEEEKAELFAKMEWQHLLWNAEEKRVEIIRWRAKKGEKYYFLSNDLVKTGINEVDDILDKKLWSTFNYFRTANQAQEAAKRIKEVLYKYHEEIGE